MKTVRFELKDHVDRMGMITALQDSKYESWVETDTKYMPPKVFIYVKVEDYEVSE